MDGTDGGNEAYSTDTLHRIAAADIGQSVPNYGFPYSYTLTNLVPGSPDRRGQSRRPRAALGLVPAPERSQPAEHGLGERGFLWVRDRAADVPRRS